MANCNGFPYRSIKKKINKQTTSSGQNVFQIYAVYSFLNLQKPLQCILQNILYKARKYIK